MKKQIWLWTVKIAAAFLWVIALFIPDIYLMIHGEETFVIKEIETEQSSDTVKVFAVEFSEDVIYGHIDVILYDENNKRVYANTGYFSDEYSRFIEIKFESKKLSQAVRFETEFPYAKSVNERKVDIISSIVATVMFILVLVALRIDYEEKVIDGKTVGVYSGLIKHRVKIDGEKVFEEKWFTLFKGKEVILNASENKDVKVMFSAMNKIDFEVIDKPANEEIKEEVKEEPKTEEKKTQKKKTTSAPKTGAKKVVSGASKKAKFQVKSTSKKENNKK